MVSSGGMGSRATIKISMVSEDRFSERDVGRLKRIITKRKRGEEK